MRFICKHTMNEHSLPKSEKLCSRTAINRLFAEGGAFIVYPLRIVYRIDDSTADPPQFFINIPKRNFKRAVKRVYLRRRIREAYRLHKFLSYIKPIPIDGLPPTSLLREFLGGSTFNY